MHGLVRSSFDVRGYGVEPCCEVGYCVAVRVVIVHSESSSEVYVVNDKALTLKIFNYVVHSFALQRVHFFDPCDLRAYVEVQTEEIEMFALLDELDELLEFVLRYAELVFVKSCCYIFVGVGVYVRIDPDGNVGLDPVAVGHLVDYIYLLERFAVEGLYAESQGVIYLLVSLSYSRIHNLVCRKSAAVGMQHLVAAYTVGAEPLGTYVFQDASLHIGLDSIVNLYVVSCSKFCNMVHGLVEQVHVVVVEWSRDPVKLFYRAVVEHVFLFFTENGCKNNEKNPYFRGLKQTNNILTVNDRTFRAGFQR